MSVVGSVIKTTHRAPGMAKGISRSVGNSRPAVGAAMHISNHPKAYGAGLAAFGAGRLSNRRSTHQGINSR